MTIKEEIQAWTDIAAELREISRAIREDDNEE